MAAYLSNLSPAAARITHLLQTQFFLGCPWSICPTLLCRRLRYWGSSICSWRWGLRLGRLSRLLLVGCGGSTMRHCWGRWLRLGVSLDRSGLLLLLLLRWGLLMSLLRSWGSGRSRSRGGWRSRRGRVRPLALPAWLRSGRLSWCLLLRRSCARRLLGDIHRGLSSCLMMRLLVLHVWLCVRRAVRKVLLVVATGHISLRLVRVWLAVDG